MLPQLIRFAWLEARACAFAVCIFAGLALSTVVDLPIARYDALFLYGVAVTVAFAVAGIETGRALLTTCLFHVTGLAFEIVKVQLGSWAYPEDAVLKVAGVPLYSGFMYAAVGSYVSRAWHLFDLTLTRPRLAWLAAISAAIYANFFTHHWLPDARLFLVVALLAATWGTWVWFTVGDRRYRMPLALAFGLIGFFLWVAENLATIFRAWQYPTQADGWQMVHVGKIGSWALLVVVAFVQVVWLMPREKVETCDSGHPLNPR